MYEIFPKKIDPVKVELEFKMMIRAFLDVAREEIAEEKEALESAAEGAPTRPMGVSLPVAINGNPR